MRYAAVIRTHPDASPRLVGVGDSRDDALAGARVWFQAQFDKTSHKDWPRLIALQDQLVVATEDELAAQTGSTLDDWLARMSAARIAPATAPPAAASTATSDDLWIPLPRRREDGSARALVSFVLIAIAIVGVLTTAKYVGGHMLQHELNDIANQDIGVSGPVYAPAIGTFDADALNGGFYDPGFDGGGETIGGIGSP
jgi:hypothetical protein